MIANISCADSSYEETLNTLKYANRAKNIRTHIQRKLCYAYYILCMCMYTTVWYIYYTILYCIYTICTLLY